MSTVNNMNSTSTDSVGLSPVLIALRTCFIAIIALLIISGNIFSIAVTRRVSNLAETTKIWMTSLAVYDLLIGFLATLSIAASAMDRWPVGDLGCELFSLSSTFCFGMSILSIVCINIERFLAVTRPYKFPVWCTPSRVKKAVVFLALFSLAFSIAVKFMAKALPEYDKIKLICDYSNISTFMHYGALFVIDIVPTSTMSLIYYRLIKISRQHEQRLNQNGNNEANNDNKALKTFLVVTLTFAGCYTPFFTMRVVETTSGESAPDWVQFLTYWLLVSNSMFNVIIYCLFNKVFRQTAKKILSERFPCCYRSVATLEVIVL